MRSLTDRDIATLRASGKISADESVILEGDIIVAIEHSTNRRRVIDTSGLMLEGTKKLLCD